MMQSLRTLALPGFFASAVFTLLISASAQGAITLTVDSNAKTFSWSGSAVSDPVVIALNGQKSFRLGYGSWIGGSISTTGVDSLSVTANFTGGGITTRYDSDLFNSRLVIAGSVDSLVSYLGRVSNSDFGGFGSPVSVSFAVTGNGQSYYYGDYTDDSITYLESLNGRQFFFQDEQGGNGTFNIGAAAGQIVVIPEPATAALAALGALTIFRRRR